MDVEEMLPHLGEIGGPSFDPDHPAGWAMPGNAAFRRAGATPRLGVDRPTVSR